MNTTHIHPTSLQLRAGGFSLIELLVSMIIGLVLTLAITALLTNNERFNKATTGLGDADQTGSYTALTLDRSFRSAGSGLTQARSAMGCLLNAGVNAPVATQLLPPPGPLPIPFNNIGTGTPLPVIRLAPAIIVDGGGPNGSDQLVLMSGTHGFSEVPRVIAPASVTATSLVVDSTMGMQANDMMLVYNNTPGSGCMVQQVAAPVAGVQLPVTAAAGPYAVGVGATTALANFGTFAGGAAVAPLGRIEPAPTPATPSNPPSFLVYGIDDSNRLFVHDLLNIAGAEPVAVGQGVFNIQALYGIGAPSPSVSAPPAVVAPPVPLAWVAPAGPVFGANVLWGPAGQSLAASTAAQATLNTIQAVRVVLVIQSAVREREAVSPASLVLFPDLPPAQQVTIPLTQEQQNYSYRIVDTVIPLRNL
jgi:type IV pilus assembly protein PilW